MNHEFCMQCGHKNLFEVSRPKFCAGCGSLLNRINSSNAKTVKIIEEEEENSDFDVSSINIEKLRKDVMIDTFAKKVSLDDLWKAPAPHDDSKRPEFSGPEGKQLLKQIQEDCAPATAAKTIDE